MAADFLEELSDSSEAATISSVTKALEKIHTVFKTSVSVKDLKKKMKLYSKMMAKLSASDKLEEELEEALVELERHLVISEAQKKQYFQTIKAKMVAKKIRNAEDLSKKKEFKKRTYLEENKVFIRSLKNDEGLKFTQICAYLNKELSDKLKSARLAPFSSNDIRYLFF